jgi:hypothetical protein
MRKNIFRIFGWTILLGALFAFAGTQEAAARAGVSINIGLPPLVLPAPPPVVVVPGTYVYAVPGVDATLLFYQGYWYRPYEGSWYVASSYNGPWGYIEFSRVPRVLIERPLSYWRVPPGYHRIPYPEFRGNWARWERERHWHGDPEWRAGWHGRPEGRGGEERGGWHEGRGRHEGRG